MQRAPQQFGQKYRLLPIWPKCGDQRLEGGTKGWRRFLAGEPDFRRQDEHRLVDNRPRVGKIKIGGTDVAQNIRAPATFAVPIFNRVASSSNPLVATAAMMSALPLKWL